MNPINAQNFNHGKTDVQTGGWIDLYLPARARPYAYLMRLDRPIGTWLLLLPGWWSLALAAPLAHDVGHVLWLGILFGVGAVMMRGAGCAVNDICDRDLDAQVARTATRPLVTGAVTPRAAMMLVMMLSLVGLVIVLQMNIAVLLMAILSLPFIVIYPLMKRITWWPQFFLGLTFNFGALMGWVAVTGGLSLAPILMYVGGIFWTLGYDTIYAHMDRMDDDVVGVKSSARALGTLTRPAVAMFYMVATILFFAAGVVADGLSFPLVIGMAIVAALFAWQVSELDIDDPRGCLRLFRFNREQGFVILAVYALCATI